MLGDFHPQECAGPRDPAPGRSGLSARASFRVLLLALAAAMAPAPAHPGPVLTFEAGLAQSAGAQFFADPTALSFRIEAASSRQLTALLVTVNGQDVTSRLAALGRLTLAPDGASGSFVAERVSLLSLGVAPIGTYRVAATVSDASGDTRIEASLSAGGMDGKLAFTTLAQGAQSGIRAVTRSVIGDLASWEALWRAHTSILTPAPPAPAVDFATQSVLAAVMGERPSSGYATEVVEARTGAPLAVLVRETRPPRDGAVMPVLTSPFHFVAIPRWTGAVLFTVLDEVIAP